MWQSIRNRWLQALMLFDQVCNRSTVSGPRCSAMFIYQDRRARLDFRGKNMPTTAALEDTMVVRLRVEF